MAWMDFLTGATPAKLEARGDRLMASGQWGQAKLAFERALAKFESAPEAPSDRCQILETKIQQAREALAREHRGTALAYLDGGHLREAREYLQLASDLTRDAALGSQLAEALASLETRLAASSGGFRPPVASPPSTSEVFEGAAAATRHERFQALCNTLPDAVAEAYESYGDVFIDGYLALNDGDFEHAVLLLERALADASGTDTYIPLELATAYLNTGRSTEARTLLETFRRHQPEVLPACELLCTIYWEAGDFDRAEALLEALPEALARSRPGTLLKGQTLHRAHRYDAARDFYRDILATHGWDADLARELARAQEALNEGREARRLYGEIMEHSRCCRGSVDPQIRHRYAELTFAEGDRSEALLERYLVLAKDLPAQAATHYDRISRIYAAHGNTRESERFGAFARRARAEQGDPSPPEGSRDHA